MKLLAVQNQISEEDNQQFLGQQVEVLVEGPSKWAKQNGDPDAQVLQLTGRTNCDRIVVFDGNQRLAGPAHENRDLRSHFVYFIGNRRHRSSGTDTEHHFSLMQIGSDATK